jgi:general secretion pathway protein G
VRPSFTFWLAIIAICAVLLFWIIPKYGSVQEDPHSLTRAKTQMACFQAALNRFEIDNNYYPTGKNGLSELLQRPNGATNWHGPYLDSDSIPKDPWGNDYVYQCPGKRDPYSFDLFSLGPDGRAGTDDDIWKWIKN